MCVCSLSQTVVPLLYTYTTYATVRSFHECVVLKNMVMVLQVDLVVILVVVAFQSVANRRQGNCREEDHDHAVAFFIFFVMFVKMSDLKTVI